MVETVKLTAAEQNKNVAAIYIMVQMGWPLQELLRMSEDALEALYDIHVEAQSLIWIRRVEGDEDSYLSPFDYEGIEVLATKVMNSPEGATLADIRKVARLLRDDAKRMIAYHAQKAAEEAAKNETGAGD